MEHNGGSAERELLKAIETGAAPAADGSLKKGKVASVAGAKGALESKLFFELNAVSKKLNEWVAGLSLNDAKNILIGLTVFFGVWAIITFASGVVSLENIPRYVVSQNVGVSGNTAEVAEKPFSLEDFAHYSEVLGGRNIFKASQKKSETGATISPIATLANNLKLAGLSWFPDKKQQFAMIEDTNTGITYFLSEGDSFLSFVVYKIQRSSVILRYRGGEEEIELR